jgi:hypothetical protein
MGYPRRPYIDSPAIDPPSTDSRFVAEGLLYVCSFLGFFGLAVTIAVILGSALLEHEIINLGVAGIAMIFFVVGISLLVAFFFRHFASRPIREFSGKTSKSDDLWDEQLDG